MMKSFKTKFVALTSLALATANSASAAVSMSGDGAVSGSLDMATFYGVAGVVIVGFGAIWAVKSGLRLLKA